jgi:hypothetical protein
MSDHFDRGDAERDDNEPLDPDIMLMVDYLARELSEREAKAVEARLVDDKAFYEKVAPIIKIWTMPVKFGDILAADAPGPDAGDLRPPFLARLRENARLTPKRRWLYKIAMAAGIALITYGISWWLSGMVGRRPHDGGARLTAQLPGVSLQPNTQVKTGRDETQVVVLRGGSRVVLSPNSEFSYRYLPTITASPTIMASFGGQAEIDVQGEDKYVLVKTSTGRALLTTGTYAMRCEPGCSAMLIAVGVGFATIWGDTAKAGLGLTAGEKGYVAKGGAPEKVMPGAGRPALDPPPPVTQRSVR